MTNAAAAKLRDMAPIAMVNASVPLLTPLPLLPSSRKEIAMSINIKDKDTCQLARELAHITGEPMDEAIATAIKERLERELRNRNVEARLRELRAISERCGRLLRDAPPGPSAVDHGDLLYDENGLPK